MTVVINDPSEIQAANLRADLAEDRVATLSTRIATLEATLREVVRVSKSGADTISFLIDLHSVARKCAAALASQPDAPVDAWERTTDAAGDTYAEPPGGWLATELEASRAPVDEDERIRRGMQEILDKQAARDVPFAPVDVAEECARELDKAAGMRRARAAEETGSEQTVAIKMAHELEFIAADIRARFSKGKT